MRQAESDSLSDKLTSISLSDKLTSIVAPIVCDSLLRPVDWFARSNSRNISLSRFWKGVSTSMPQLPPDHTGDAATAVSTAQQAERGELDPALIAVQIASHFG